MSAADPLPGRRSMAAELSAVGAILGIPVVVGEHDDWELGAHGLRVGEGWYLRRGHGTREAAALAALQLWEGPRAAVRFPARERRRRALEGSRPELAPLLGAVTRAQSIAEILTSMPGLNDQLRTAVQRSLPSDLSTLPRHLQWAALVLAHGVDRAAIGTVEDRSVLEEWRLLHDARGPLDPLRRVLAPNPEVSPLRRLERSLALLLPSYERLLERDAAELGRTVLGGSDRAELSLHAEDRLGSDDFAPSDELSEEHMSESEVDDAQEVGESDHTAPELAELFASEHERFAETVISTPIPEASRLFDAAVRFAETLGIPDDGRPELGEASSAGNGGSGAVTILADYRSRAEELAEAIDGVRALWGRVISDRIAPRRTRSRSPLAEGDELATESLASTVADTLAGERQPDAFHRRLVRPRLTRNAGSTDYVLMIDRSASMSGVAAESAADAVLVMIEAFAAAERDIVHAERVAGIDLELDIRTCLIVFDAEAVVLKPLSQGLDDSVRRRMHGEVRSPSGSTNDAAALRAAADQLGIGGTASPGANGVSRRRIAILVSDGGSNDVLAAERELRRLRAAGVHVHGVGVGTEDIALRYAPDGASITDARELPLALTRIVEQELG